MTVIDEHLAKLDLANRAALERIRAIVRAEVPTAVEAISYGMPAFKYQGKYLLGFDAFTDHLGLFPTPEPIEVLRSKLGDYKLSKGTVQFTLEKPLPEALIKEIIHVRMRVIMGS